MSRTKKHNQKYAENKTQDELIEELRRLENENKTLRSELSKYTDKHQPRRSKKDRSENAKFEAKKERPQKVLSSDPECPNCGAKIKETTLPFGKIKLCTSSCGWRLVENNK